MPHARRCAGFVLLAVLAAAAPTAAAQERSQVVLSVNPAFRTASLPAGSEVRLQLPRVGAVVASVPSTALRSLSRVPGVRGARPDVVMTTTGAASGSGTGHLAPEQVGGGAGAPGAGQGVTVAVLDTGVSDSPSLNRQSGRLYRGPDFSKESGSSGLRDQFGHGTFMANLVAGGVNDGRQIGIAPGAKVVDVKVAGSDGTTTLSKVLQGLDWVAKNASSKDIEVLSLSLGAPRPSDGYGADPLTDGAEKVQAAGVAVVVAAGNSADALTDPGQDPMLMTVGAADLSKKKAAVADFSGRGVVSGLERPDLVAPGLHLLSVLPEGSTLAVANPSPRDGALALGTGTSQATAVTAGAVAVFLGKQGALDAQTIRTSFAAVADPLKDFGDGAGLLVIPTKVTSPPQGWGTGNDGTSFGGDPSTQGSSWSASSWGGSSWSGSSWSGSSWSGSSWSASSWGGSSWSGSSWSGSSWSGSSWSGSSWSGSSWSGSSWSACGWI